MEKFLERHKLLKLTQEETENLNIYVYDTIILLVCIFEISELLFNIFTSFSSKLIINSW